MPRTKVLLRNNIAMRSKDNGSCEVLDLRTNLTNPAVIQPHGELLQETTQINASDNYIYLSNDYIDIRDLRKTSEPVWISPLALVRPEYSAFE